MHAHAPLLSHGCWKGFTSTSAPIVLQGTPPAPPEGIRLVEAHGDALVVKAPREAGGSGRDLHTFRDLNFCHGRGTVPAQRAPRGTSREGARNFRYITNSIRRFGTKMAPPVPNPTL